jgi:hypothetical protein
MRPTFFAGLRLEIYSAVAGSLSIKMISLPKGTKTIEQNDTNAG